MEFSKEFLEELLKAIIEAFDSGEAERIDWYADQFPDEFGEAGGYYINDVSGEYGDEVERHSAENVLAIEAIKYPELHPLMVELLEKITQFNSQHSEMWEADEEQAGNSIARELCKYDKKYFPLYFELIQTNDLDHEVYQTNDLVEVFEKWDYSPEVMPLLLYRSEHGQQSYMYSEFADGICKSKEDAQKYLDSMAIYFDDQWGFTSADSVDFDDAESLTNMLSPLFKELFELSDNQMSQFVLAYNNSMAQGKKPKIEQLLEAAK